MKNCISNGNVANITLRNKVLNMEQEKEYNDFIALGRKYYPKQDDKSITTFNSVVLANVYPKKKDILDNYGVTKCELFALIMMEGFFSRV